MKKILALTMLSMLVFGTYAQARTHYDSSNRIINSNSIRAQRRAKEAQAYKTKQLQAAAAAKLDYEEALKSLEPKKPENNFIQSQIREENNLLYGK